MQTPEKLTWRDRLLNLSIATHGLLFGPWMAMLFFVRINQHRGPHVSSRLRLPRSVAVDTLNSGGVPGGLITQWEQYGIPSAMLPFSFVRVVSGRKERVCRFWVSPDAHWMADRCARPYWLVVSPAVWCPRRGSSAVDAARGAWRASGRQPRAHDWSIRALGDLLGLRQAYANIVRNTPGLRRHKGK